uniref:Single-stranded DNA-binding protein 2-like n=1 Tax=Sinocyclocheilus grahami TaxID=75366 RepID=A0A672LT51_SINGR
CYYKGGFRISLQVDLSLNLYNSSFVLCLTWQIRWEKNITLGEPPGFLHSWWCVFWDLYCAAHERRETCEHSSEAKAFHDYVSINMCSLDNHDFQFMSPRYPGGPRGSLRIPNQALGPGNQTLLPSGMDPTRQPGHPNMSGPMQRMTPRGMVPIGPQNYGGGMRPPLNALVGPGMPGINITFSPQITYSSASPGSYSGPPAGGGPPGTSIMPSPTESNNSSDNMYSLISSVPPNGNRPNFPLGSGPDGPIGSMASMEPHHMNGSLGSGDIESLPKSSPVNLSMNNQPGTPRDDGEMSGNFLNPFQSESYSPNITMSV